MSSDIKEKLQYKLRDLASYKVIDLRSCTSGALFQVRCPKLYLEKEGLFFYKTQLIHLMDYLTILKNLSNQNLCNNELQDLCDSIFLNNISFKTTHKLDECTVANVIIRNQKHFGNYYSHRDIPPIALKRFDYVSTELLSYNYEKIYNKSYYEIRDELNCHLDLLESQSKFFNIKEVFFPESNNSDRPATIKQTIKHLEAQQIMVNKAIEAVENNFDQWISQFPIYNPI